MTEREDRQTSTVTDKAFLVFAYTSAPVFLCFLFEDRAPSLLPVIGWSLQGMTLLVLITCFAICLLRRTYPSPAGWVALTGWSFFTLLYVVNNG
ncbi:hypothetical protein [Streptomyces sp. NPDC048111]|uniref:hypothetical protein n=1 Tax=Streptomyces sp. NPDC048111 TaxID=3365500 RepID=UPI003711B866